MQLESFSYESPNPLCSTVNLDMPLFMVCFSDLLADRQRPSDSTQMMPTAVTGVCSQMSKSFLTVQVITRAKSKLLSQQALKLWRQQILAFPISDIVHLWGLSGRRKLSQLSLSSLITVPPGTASLLSSSQRSHSAQNSFRAVPRQFAFSTRGLGC